jgi:hypothetical protein
MFTAMRPLLIFPSLLFALLTAPGQTARKDSQSTEQVSTKKALVHLRNLADEAHTKGDIEQEIEFRQRLSREAWANFIRNPESPGMFNRWMIVFLNDLPLGVLLEGTHEWEDAEAIFRHNQSELEHEPLAGDDIKSTNQLQLAHLLVLEGKDTEARRICSHWEKRVRRIGDSALRAVEHSVPAPPVYDTPEVETARWDLACGRRDEGLRLISQQMAAHPRMLAAYTVPSQYYFAEGDFQNALKVEKDGVSKLLGH